MKVDGSKMQVIHNGVEESFLEADPSLFIKKFSIFNEEDWMYRWLAYLPDNDGDSQLRQEDK